MLSLNAVCNQIIRKSISTNTNLTPLKLQKLLYLIYAHSIKENNGYRVFDATFNAWQYGPVCIPVYEEFSSFGSGQITSYFKDAKGQSYFPNPDVKENTPFFNAFNFVWDKYGNLTGAQLVDLTHGRNNTAWFKTKTNHVIQDELIIEDVSKGVY